MKLRIPDRLVDWLVRRAKRRPYTRLDGYMERYWLLRTPWFAVRLHRILRSDDDRALHDHPWDYATVILRGGYIEVRPRPANYCDYPDPTLGPTVREWIGPGRALLRRAESLHRLELPDGQPCITLFITGRRRRTWGFQTPDGWVSHRDYERMIQEGTIPHAWRGAAS